MSIVRIRDCKDADQFLDLRNRPPRFLFEHSGLGDTGQLGLEGHNNYPFFSLEYLLPLKCPTKPCRLAIETRFL
jgi:hypothetical protein